MSDALEQELRAALAESASSMPAATAATDRLREVDYRSRRPLRLRWLPARLPMWPALGGAAAALAGGIATAAVMLSSGTTAAYAGWTPVPTTPTAPVLATMKAVCKRDAGPLLDAAMTGELMLADQRGSYIAALYADGTDAGVCFWHGGSFAGGSGTAEQFHAPPGPDQLGLWSEFSAPAPGSSSSGTNQSQSSVQHLLNSQFFRDHPAIRASVRARFRAMHTGGYGADLYGRAGSDVAAVSFVVYGGVTVRATVKNGWYFAWWPGAAWLAGVRAATAVIVTTRSGATLRSPMSGSRCQQDSSCVFAGFNHNVPPLPPNGATAITQRPAPGVPTRTSATAQATTTTTSPATTTTATTTTASIGTTTAPAG